MSVSRAGSFADGVGRHSTTLHIFACLLQARLSSSWAAGCHPALHCIWHQLHWPAAVAPPPTYRRCFCLLFLHLTASRVMLINHPRFRCRRRALPGVVATSSHLLASLHLLKCRPTSPRAPPYTWSFDPQFHHSTRYPDTGLLFPDVLCAHAFAARLDWAGGGGWGVC